MRSAAETDPELINKYTITGQPGDYVDWDFSLPDALLITARRDDVDDGRAFDRTGDSLRRGLID